MDIPGKENCKGKCVEDTAVSIQYGEVFEVLECQVEERGLYSGREDCRGCLSRDAAGHLERSIPRLGKGRSVERRELVDKRTCLITKV